MLEGLVLPQRVWPCRVRDVANELSAEDKKILLDAADNPEWPYLTLEQSLAKLGVAVSQQSLKKHRSKACSCFRSK